MLPERRRNKKDAIYSSLYLVSEGKGEGQYYASDFSEIYKNGALFLLIGCCDV